MVPFVRTVGTVLPLDRTDVDTDQILPREYMKRIERTGFEPYLFHELRYLESGEPDPGFVLNRPGHRDSTILVSGRNFGCGSSREVAVFALADYGFRVLIAPSFGEILYNNCFNNGILPVIMPEKDVRYLLDRASAMPGYRLAVDLESCTVSDENGFLRSFEIEGYRRHRLLSGLDEVSLTLQLEDRILAYEERIPPWRHVRFR